VDLLAILRWMYAEVHRDEHSPKQPFPTPVPRPGVEQAPAADPASVYAAAGDVPAIPLEQLGAWLAT